MQDFERLGVFYLGRRYDVEREEAHRRPGPLRLQGSRHARALRRHDRKRQDRSRHRGHRRSRDRRGAGHRHRPEGRSHEPAADVSGSAPRRTFTVGQRGRCEARREVDRPSSPPSRRSGGRTGSPSGARTALASSVCAMRRSSRSTRRAAPPASRCRCSRRSNGRPATTPELVRERVQTTVSSLLALAGVGGSRSRAASTSCSPRSCCRRGRRARARIWRR